MSKKLKAHSFMINGQRCTFYAANSAEASKMAQAWAKKHGGTAQKV